MSKSERIIIIGASQTGKTTFAINNIVNKFKYIHYFGPEHNVLDYTKGLKRGAELTCNNDPMKAYQVFVNTMKYKTMYPDSDIPCQLLIFDDVIDQDFIKTDECRQLFCAGRHLNLSICVMAHSPNIVITPVMKNNCTQIVICQYYHTKQFEDILDEFFLGMLFTGTEKKNELNMKMQRVIYNTFKYKYAKLIIRPLDNTWSQWFPAKREEKSNTNVVKPIIGFNDEVNTQMKSIMNNLNKYPNDDKIK